MPARPAPTAVVLDAFGTLVHIRRPARPFAMLRAKLADKGVDVSDFSTRAMAGRHTLADLAAQYSGQGDTHMTLEDLAALDGLLLDELERIEPYPDAERTLRYLLGHGATVIVASNLAWPYGLPLRASLRQMTSGDSCSQSSGIWGTFFSYEQGVLKPDPGFYTALERYIVDSPGIARDRIFMVGDKLAEDVNAPITAGWQAWHLDRPAGASLLDAPWDRWLAHGRG